ncbi:pyridoxal phosphate-dependent aminotransferase [Martelella mediterranea]|uniref:histidinol-phosphate transaminase n=1 Tax=Martelella mediterranea TaxID=293089 RepID=A0A4R3NUG4_9HYPH|nr:pyridoxal phosphate-dependent aminotransferase [Martelella mediterranea]TCT40948.1 histidinol-phosphate aminotransferase [Martelella mediterranea]
MDAFSRITDLINSLPATVPFVGPEALERQTGTEIRARIGANESAFGPAPSVVEATRQAAGDVWKYSDSEHFSFRHKLAEHLACKPENIMVGEGVDGLLGMTARLTITQGTPVVMPLGGYPTFAYHVDGFGGRIVTVPYEGDRESIDGLLDSVRKNDATVVYFANPDNPMGSWWNEDDVVRFAQALPETCLLILDEAYCECGPAEAFPSIDRLINMPNVLRFRTFSKAYGLAGARVGYAIGTEGTIAAFNKIRNHFGMTRLSMVAAEAALADQAYLQTVIARIHESRAQIGRIAEANGFKALPSATNFVAVDCGRDGDYARAIVNRLGARGVFIRMPGVAPLNRCIRISAAPNREMEILAETLPQVVSEIG